MIAWALQGGAAILDSCASMESTSLLPADLFNMVKGWKKLVHFTRTLDYTDNPVPAVEKLLLLLRFLEQLTGIMMEWKICGYV